MEQAERLKSHARAKKVLHAFAWNSLCVKTIQNQENDIQIVNDKSRTSRSTFIDKRKVYFSEMKVWFGLKSSSEFGHMGTLYKQDPPKNLKIKLCLSYTTCDEITKNTPSDTGLKVLSYMLGKLSKSICKNIWNFPYVGGRGGLVGSFSICFLQLTKMNLKPF